jgi:hypothetical protein
VIVHLSDAAVCYLSLICVGLLLAARDHGKPRGAENFWTSLIAVIIQVSILAWGGFFK